MLRSAHTLPSRECSRVFHGTQAMVRFVMVRSRRRAPVRADASETCRREPPPWWSCHRPRLAPGTSRHLLCPVLHHGGGIVASSLKKSRCRWKVSDCLLESRVVRGPSADRDGADRLHLRLTHSLTSRDRQRRQAVIRRRPRRRLMWIVGQRPHAGLDDEE